MEERILVAVDGSENSLEALKEAVKLAEVIPCKITVLNVQPSFHTIHTKMFINEKVIKEYQQELFDNAIKSAIDYVQTHNVEFELKLLIGDPVQQICKFVDEFPVKYIVLGSRGLGMVKKTVLGSVSSGVLHETNIPILIVPQKK